MAKFPDSTPLVSMNLPGTHDTATCTLRIYVYCGSARISTGNYSDATQASLIRYTGPYVADFNIHIQPLNLQYLYNSPRVPPADNNRCQEHSIMQSLNEGIRVFDLRLAYNPGNDTIGFWHCEHLS